MSGAKSAMKLSGSGSITANATAVWAIGDFETRMYHNINNLQKW